MADTIQADRRELLSALELAAKAVPAHSPVEVLQGVYLLADAVERTLSFTATNLEVLITRSIPLQVADLAREERAAVVPAGILRDFLLLSSTSAVSLSFLDGELLVAMEGDCRMQCKCYPPEDYPIAARPEPDQIFPVRGLVPLLEQVLSAADTRADSTGVKIALGNDRIRLSASDGRRLAVSEGAAEAIEMVCVISTQAARQLLTQLRQPEEIGLGLQGNELVCTGPGFQFRALLKKNSCMDENKLLSHYRADCMAMAAAEELRTGIRTVTALDSRGTLQLTFRNQSIQMDRYSENGCASIQAAARLRSPEPPGPYWVRAEELLQGLSRFQGQIEILASRQALVLRNASSLYFLVGTNPPDKDTFRQKAEGAGSRKRLIESAA